MKNTDTIQITEEDEKWLREGVIGELIEKHKYKKNEAVNLFNESPLLAILYDDPEDIFHHSTSYWANFLVTVTKWNPFENHSCGDYDSKNDDEFQEMKGFYENMPKTERFDYKKDLYEGMVEDGIIEKVTNLNHPFKLMPLDELERSIEKNGHLPDIPSAEEVKNNGVSVGEMQARLLQKIEELTLYVIEQGKELKQLKSRNEMLGKQVANLQTAE